MRVFALHQALVDGEDVFFGGLTRVARGAHVVEGVVGQCFQIGFGCADFGDGGRVLQVDGELVHGLDGFFANRLPGFISYARGTL